MKVSYVEGKKGRVSLASLRLELRRGPPTRLARRVEGSQRREVSFGCDVRHQPDDPGHLIERAQVVSRGGEYVQSRDTRRFASLFYVILSAQPAYELRFMPNERENATEIKQVARLDTFNVGADRSGCGPQLNAELRKPALRVRRLRALWAHHLPECAPPSTCSTSPVTLRASVR